MASAEVAVAEAGAPQTARRHHARKVSFCCGSSIFTGEGLAFLFVRRKFEACEWRVLLFMASKNYHNYTAPMLRQGLRLCVLSLVSEKTIAADAIVFPSKWVAYRLTPRPVPRQTVVICTGSYDNKAERETYYHQRRTSCGRVVSTAPANGLEEAGERMHLW